MDKIRLAVIGDSPKLHTGFGTVIERLCAGWHEAGLELHVLGLHDHEFDYLNQLPYNFTPTNHFDDLAHNTYGLFLQRVKPDVVFTMTDPGNLYNYMAGIINRHQGSHFRRGEEYIPPVVAYIPIEGVPQEQGYGQGFEWVEATGGKLAVYTHWAAQVVQNQWPSVEPVVIPHGLDHANFRRYSDHDRQTLKRLAGLDNYFVVGCVGVNKRTKGYPQLIEVARCLKLLNQHEGIKFYCHTNPQDNRMYGYKLKELTEYYDVADMFLWKQVTHAENYWLGIDRQNGTLDNIGQIAEQVPDSPQKRGYLFAHYDFVSMLNCLDLYVDLSQVEGWGLPVGEAMLCGVPTLMIDDHSNRKEIYEGGVHWLKPLPLRLWETWHTGSRLATCDPLDVAKLILKARDDHGFREDLSQKAQVVAGKYRWAPVQQQFTELITQVYENIKEIA